MKRVVIESPYRNHGDPEQRRLYGAYLDACLKDCYDRGEAPIASHAIGPRVLNDNDPDDRELGMAAGFAWTAVADLVAVYADLGVSPGMEKGIKQGILHGVQIESRMLGGHWAAILDEVMYG